MDQYPKWFLALNFPNVLIALGTMVFFLFGGIHPFGSYDSMFWNFIVYILTQLLWVMPCVLFFFSLMSWGMIREKLAIGVAIGGWIINAISLAFILNA